MDEKNVIGTSCLGKPIYGTEHGTDKDALSMAIASGCFDAIVVASDGKGYVMSDKPGLYYPIDDDGVPDLSRQVPLPA